MGRLSLVALAIGVVACGPSVAPTTVAATTTAAPATTLAVTTTLAPTTTVAPTTTLDIPTLQTSRDSFRWVFEVTIDSTEVALTTIVDGDFRAPDALQLELTVLAADQEIKQQMVLIGGQGWQSVDGVNNWTPIDSTGLTDLLALTPLPTDGWYASFIGFTNQGVVGEPDEFEGQPATRIHIDQESLEDLSALGAIFGGVGASGVEGLDQLKELDMTIWMSEADGEPLAFDMSFLADPSLIGSTGEEDVKLTASAAITNVNDQSIIIRAPV